jgi:hypothetical protein
MTLMGIMPRSVFRPREVITTQFFGDMNQQGAIKGNCKSSQNGRGGLFFVIDDAELSNRVKDLIRLVLFRRRALGGQ